MRFDGNLLTLDLATNTGWCAGLPSNPNPDFGHVTMPSTGDDIGTFAVAFDRELSGLLDKYTPGLVVFEAPILPKQTQPMTVRKLCGLAWETEKTCRQRGIRCREGRASTVKKFFAGTGRAQKVDTMSVCRRYGWRVRTDDEADACALWAYSVACFAPDHASRFALGPMGARELF